jgi:hypothetical protein
MPTSSKEEEVNLNGSILIESLTASTTPPPRFLSLSRLEILYPLGNSSWLETELSSHVSVKAKRQIGWLKQCRGN